MKYVATLETMPPCGKYIRYRSRSATVHSQTDAPRMTRADLVHSPYTKDGRSGYLVRAYRALTSVCVLWAGMVDPLR
jgi:hypothetical protein